MKKALRKVSGLFTFLNLPTRLSNITLISGPSQAISAWEAFSDASQADVTESVIWASESYGVVTMINATSSGVSTSAASGTGVYTVTVLNTAIIGNTVTVKGVIPAIPDATTQIY